jgi:hypothetical protein
LEFRLKATRDIQVQSIVKEAILTPISNSAQQIQKFAGIR